MVQTGERAVVWECGGCSGVYVARVRRAIAVTAMPRFRTFFAKLVSMARGLIFWISV